MSMKFRYDTPNVLTAMLICWLLSWKFFIKKP